MREFLWLTRRVKRTFFLTIASWAQLLLQDVLDFPRLSRLILVLTIPFFSSYWRLRVQTLI